ncbi:hypothetical protein [uncultured Rikenella sp.]|uniref:hypothetical protein n=1 Tax=uncultured Rikenella sp. TaxID=368003 RepID=UPI0025DD6DC0|nr:hypothetical protein [uncultured Rikenella sp.]
MLGGLGYHGFNWSSTTYNDNGMYLDFNTENLYPSGANRRAYALQLRCLSE